MKKFLLTATLAVCAAATLSAASIIGGDGLFQQSYANQVEAWLGRTNVAFTNIYTETTGIPEEFHAAVDGQGETVTLYQTNLGLVGGYNPVSWTSLGTNTTDPTNVGRTAFIFNLSTPAIQHQRLLPDPPNDLGQYQTFNASSYGPSFGVYDLGFIVGETLSSLDSGLASANAYGTLGTSIFGTAGSTYFTASKIETFTISQQSADASAPEPATAGMMVGAFGLLAWMLRKRALAIR